tara:strand:- start:271 stop:594 length:324 start_codon:yes stop_codon:yes gene_type:complete
MQTKIKLNRNYSSEPFIITSSGAVDDNTLANFIAAVASGSITIECLKTNFCDSELFVKTEESYLDHSWETVIDANPSFHAVGIIKEKSPLLLKLEAKAKTASKKEAA